MKHAGIVGMALAACSLVGCAASHERASHVDAAVDGAHDPGLGRDDAGLAPPCAPAPPRCVSVVRSQRDLERPEGPGALALEALAVAAGRVHTLLRIEAPDESEVRLVDRVHTMALAPSEPIEIDRVEHPNARGASVAATGDVVTFAWHHTTSHRGDGTVETRWRAVGPAGAGAIAVADAVAVPSRALGGLLGPAVLALGGRTVAMRAMDGELALVDLAASSRRALPVAASAWGAVAAQPVGDGELFAVLWHELGADDFAVARVAIASADALVAGPVTALSRLSDRAVLLVDGGDVLVAGFERTTTLGASRLRIARLRTADLAPVELDGSFRGWGGAQPRGFELVRWRGERWLVWLAHDPRFAPQAAVFAEPLPAAACAREVGDPALVSSARLDPTERYGVLAVAAGAAEGDDEQLFVAHLIGREGAFDLHALTACAP